MTPAQLRQTTDAAIAREDSYFLKDAVSDFEGMATQRAEAGFGCVLYRAPSVTAAQRLVDHFSQLGFQVTVGDGYRVTVSW